MQDICGKLSRTAAVVVITLAACVGSAWAGGVPWQVGDIVVCYGGGTCNVIRLHGNTVQVLDTISSGLLGSNGGVGLNNTLHVLATDDGNGTTHSNLVVYSIASIQPFLGTVLNHSVINTYNGTGNSGDKSAAVAVSSAGHIFVGNSNGAGASIVELPANGTPTASVFTFPTSGPCATTTINSIDIGANADAIYVTASDGIIRKVALPLFASSVCSQFANFGSLVNLYGIKDIPAGALSGTCGSNPPNNPPNNCPTGESVLVVAKGFTDPDADTNEGGETPPNQADPDAVNICTNTTGAALVSCGLLLDTNLNPGLNATLWQAGTAYSTTDKILDPSLHLQTVYTAGTSGSQEPTFSETGGTVMDNAVIWTDKNQPQRSPDTSYTQTAFPGTYVVDSNSNLQTVTTSGISSHDPQPNWHLSATTVDGLQWQDQGAWQANHGFGLGAAVGDSSGHPHTVLTAGTSGGTLPPWNDNNGVTIDNAVIWTNQGAVLGYSGNHQYALNNLIVVGGVGGHAQQVVEPGTSGGAGPNFSITGGRTIDGAVIWTDQGQEFWHPSFAFPLNAVIVDPAGHVQQVTTAGTSGTTQPVFNDSNSTTSDNTVTWTDQGVLIWAANSNYDGSNAAKTFVVDAANHLQKATTTGISGPAQPTFNDGGLTTDGAAVWADQGQKFWYPNFAFAANSIIVDTAGHVQQVTTAGTSGPTQPTFNDTTGSVTDGLQWTDEGPAGTWAQNHNYNLNDIIVDGALHIQQVVTPGQSGGSQPSFNDTGLTTPDGTVTWQDRGVPGTWTANTQYALNAIINDGGNVQQATSAGTSGASTAPTFSQTIGGTPVSDNAVVWTDEGLLSGSVTFNWQPGHNYNANDQILDPAGHVQKVSTAGMSGGTQPAFTDGGTVIDGLVWLDLGPTVTWSATTSFPLGTLTVDTGSFLQKVTTAGISTTPGPPAWNETPTSTTVDGLQWTDEGHLVWMPNTHFWTLNALISDSNTHAQKVVQTGTSGGGTPGFSTTGLTVNDHAVIWTESHLNWAANHNYVVGNTDTLILDGKSHVQLVTTSGTSGPTTPPFTSNNPGAGQTIDGLQWKVQTSPSTSVIARYPAPAGVTGLQSLALDPLVSNCTGGNPAGTACSTGSLPTRMVTDSNLVPNTNQVVPPSFWMGDTSGTGKIYRQNFAGGAAIGIPGACSSGCVIQSMVVYGGESANQPGLASLVVNGTLNSGDSFTASPNFLGNSIRSTLSNNGTGSPPATAISLYASAVDPTSCFNDPSAGSIGCKPFNSSPSQALVLKIDIPLNGMTALSSSQTLNTAITPPTGFFDNGTDVFVDEQFDDTTFVGGDPGTRTVSVHSLHEITPHVGTAQCTYSSPLQNGCYKTNRGTLNFIFTCTGLNQTQFQNLQPVLSLVKKDPTHVQAPLFIPLQGTNSKGPYRFNATSNFWTFQWNLNGATAGTYQGTTFDNSFTVQSFPVTFRLANSCP